VGPKEFQDTLKRAGARPSHGTACLFPIQGNLVLLMANHEYGINATVAAQVAEATLRARGEINQIVRGLRQLGGPWDGVQIVATPKQIGVRDGRRIRGRYIMTADDLINGTVQDDAVVRAKFPVDIHTLTAEDNKKAGLRSFSVTHFCPTSARMIRAQVAERIWDRCFIRVNSRFQTRSTQMSRIPGS